MNSFSKILTKCGKKGGGVLFVFHLGTSAQRQQKHLPTTAPLYPYPVQLNEKLKKHVVHSRIMLDGNPTPKDERVKKCQKKRQKERAKTEQRQTKEEDADADDK